MIQETIAPDRAEAGPTGPEARQGGEGVRPPVTRPSSVGEPAISGQELARVAALRGSGVLLTRPQDALEALARAAAALCAVPIGLINFLDETTVTTAAATEPSGLQPGTVAPRSTVPCQFTIRRLDEITEIADLAADPRTAGLAMTAAGIRFYAGANITSDARLSMGTICVSDVTPRALSPAQRTGLQDLAAVASELVEQFAVAQRLVGVADRLGREAGLDPLTGLHNRRALEPILANLPAGTAVAMVDLDQFKQLNDRVGHDGGDRVLCAYADLFRSALRDGDVAARWGGEEFLIVLEAGDDPRRAFRRLRAASAAQAVSFSAGLTISRPGEDPRALLQRADRLLYQAKEAGRGRTTDDLVRAPAGSPMREVHRPRFS